MEIDPSSRRVKRAGKEIHLTRREFRLLQFLIAHQGRTVTQSMILENLCRGLAERKSNIVAVYIRYLRAKIDHGFSPPLILTRWGKGYLFRDEAAGRSTPVLHDAAATPKPAFTEPRPRRRPAAVDFQKSAT
jgi:two-component system OmpR family response regulator